MVGNAGAEHRAVRVERVERSGALLAELIELARAGNSDPAHARVEALMVLVSLSAFETGRPVLRRFVGRETDLAAQERTAIVGSFIERLYGRPPTRRRGRTGQAPSDVNL
jgi:hypothetical protein